MLEQKDQSNGSKLLGKKKKKVIIAVISVLLICCILSSCFSALFVLAFNSSINIPGLTQIAELFERKTIDPQTYVSKRRDDLANQVVEFLQPATSEGGMSYEEYMERLADLEDDSRVSASGIKYEVEIKSENTVNDSSDMKVSLKGSADIDNENDRAKTEMEITLEEGVSENGKLELVIDSSETDPTIFFKVKDFSFLQDAEKEADFEIDDEWFRYSQKELQDYIEEMGGDADDMEAISFEDTFKLELSEEELNSIEELLKQEDVLGDIKWEDARTFDGHRARCLSHNWNSDHIKSIIDAIAESDLAEGEDIPEDELDLLKESVENVDYINLYYCFDRADTSRVYEVEFSAKVRSDYPSYSYDEVGEEGEVITEFSFKVEYSGYGESKNVELPEDSKSVIDIVKEIVAVNERKVEEIRDIEVKMSTMYTLYTQEGCPHCVTVQEYMEKNDIEDNFFVTVRDISEDEFASEMFQSTCDMNKDLTCGVPLLEIYDMNIDDSSDFPEPEYISGSENIIEYFEKELAKEA